jgi:PAS domain S-box-containing protein
MINTSQNNAKVTDFLSSVYFCSDEEGLISYISPVVEQTHGKLPSEIVGKKHLNDFLFDDADEYDDFMGELKSKEHLTPRLIKSKNKQGYLMFLKISVKIIKANSGKSSIIEGFFQDVTKAIVSGVSPDEVKQDENQSRNFEHAELVRALINSGNDVIFAKDAAGKFVFVNKTFSELAGRSQNEIAGKTGSEIISFSNRMAIEEFCVLRYPIKKRSYITVTLMDDSVEYFLPDVKQVKLQTYEKPLVLITARNVTPIAKAEMAMSRINDTLSEMVAKRTEELELSTRNFSVLFEKGNEIKFLTRPNGKILKTNEKARTTFGFSEKKMTDLNITDILEKDYYIQRPKITEAMEKNGSATFEGRLRTADGNLLPVEVNSVKVNYEGGPAYYATARNISHRKEAQRKVLQAILVTEETERKRFAKELHDGLGALISAIKMYIDLLLEEKISKDRVPAILKSAKDLVDEAAFSAREIANNIKPHMLSNFGLEASLKEFVNKVGKTQDINIKLFYDNFSGKLEDEVELTVYRIITELVNNTLKYAEASDLRIALRKKNEKLTVLYSDNGKGFDLDKVLQLENRGNGVKNLIARSENLNANLRLAAVSGKGIFVRLKSDLTL